MEITSWETTVHKCVCLCVDNGTWAGGICLSPSRGCFDQYLWSNLKGSIRWQKCKQRAYSQIAHNVIHNATDPHPYTHPADPHPKCCWSYIFHKNHWFPFTAGEFSFYLWMFSVGERWPRYVVGWLVGWLASRSSSGLQRIPSTTHTHTPQLIPPPHLYHSLLHDGFPYRFYGPVKATSPKWNETEWSVCTLCRRAYFYLFILAI